MKFGKIGQGAVIAGSALVGLAPSAFAAGVACPTCVAVSGSSTSVSIPGSGGVPVATMIPVGAKLANNSIYAGSVTPTGFVASANPSALVSGTASIEIFSTTPTVELSVGRAPELTANAANDSAPAAIGYNFGRIGKLPPSLTPGRTLSVSPLNGYASVASSRYLHTMALYSRQLRPTAKQVAEYECTEADAGSPAQCWIGPNTLTLTLVKQSQPQSFAVYQGRGLTAERFTYAMTVRLNGPARSFINLSVEGVK